MDTEIGVRVVLRPAVEDLGECCGLSAARGQVLLQDEHQRDVAVSGEVSDILGDKSPAVCPGDCRDLRVVCATEAYFDDVEKAKAHLGPVLPAATPVQLETDWRAAPLIKARLAGGFCLRSLAQGPCAYANICEHCPNFRSDASFLPVLRLQRVDAEALAEDAEARGWGEEATRHRRLIERIDGLIDRANAS